MCLQGGKIQGRRVGRTRGACGEDVVPNLALSRRPLLRFGRQTARRQFYITDSTGFCGELLIQLKQLRRNLTIEELLRREMRVPPLSRDQCRCVRRFGIWQTEER